MKVLKYLTALWLSIAVYSVISMFYGAMGLFAYEQLLSGRDLQWANMRELSAINSELEKAQNNLLYDRDIITMHAQSLGYARDGEQFIRIVGLGGIRNPHDSTGNIVRTPSPGFIPDSTIKLCALFAGIVALALIFVFSVLRRGKSR